MSSLLFPDNLLQRMIENGLLYYDGQRYHLHDSIKKALPVSPVSLTSAIAYFQNLKQKDPIAVDSETPLFEHLTNAVRELWSPSAPPSPNDALKKLEAAGLLRHDGQRYHLHDSVKKALPVSPVSLTSAIAYFQNLKQKDPIAVDSEKSLLDHLNNTARQVLSPPAPPAPNDALKQLAEAGLIHHDGRRYYLHDSIKKALPVSPVSLTSTIAYFQNLKQKDPIAVDSEKSLLDHLNNTARQVLSPPAPPAPNDALKQLAEAGLIHHDGQRYYLHDSIKKAIPVSPVSLTSAIAYFQNLKQKDPVAVDSEKSLFDHLNNTARQLWSPTVDIPFEEPKPKPFNKIKEFFLKQGSCLAAGLAIGYFLTPLPPQFPTFSQASEQKDINKKSQQNPSYLSGNTNPDHDQSPLISSGILTSETRPSSQHNLLNNSDNKSLHSSVKKSSAKITPMTTVSHIALQPLQILQNSETDRQTKFSKPSTDSVASLLGLAYDSANSVLLPSIGISFVSFFSAMDLDNLLLTRVAETSTLIKSSSISMGFDFSSSLKPKSQIVMVSSSPKNMSQNTNNSSDNNKDIPENYRNISSAEDPSVVAVPEPLTILGGLIAVIFGVVFRWKLGPS